MEWNKQTIQKLLMDNPQAVLRATLLLYDCQTPEEKYLEHSGIKNHEGFNQWDSPYLSKISKKLIAHEKLTIAEFMRTREMILKYWKQIIGFIPEEREIVPEAPKPSCDYMICDECHNAECGLLTN